MKSEETSGVTCQFPQPLLQQADPHAAHPTVVSILVGPEHVSIHHVARHVTSHHVTSHMRCWGLRRKGTRMQRSSYGERDYTFGQTMLTLRTSIGLTQADLAKL